MAAAAAAEAPSERDDVVLFAGERGWRCTWTEVGTGVAAEAAAAAAAGPAERRLVLPERRGVPAGAGAAAAAAAATGAAATTTGDGREDCCWRGGRGCGSGGIGGVAGLGAGQFVLFAAAARRDRPCRRPLIS